MVYFLTLIAIACFIFSRYIKADKPALARLLVIAVPILPILGLLLSSLTTIDTGTVGVIKLFGKVQPEPIQSGLHLVNPIADVTEMDVKTQNYTMSATSDEGKKGGDDGIRALTSDGLEVVLDLSVLYNVIPADAPAILSTIGGNFEDKVIRPLSRTIIRDNAVYYTAVDLYSTKRNEFQTKIQTLLEKAFLQRGIKLQQILIRNINLPEAVKTSIQNKINAEIDAQKMEFTLQKIQKEAEGKRLEAQGIADYQRIINTGLTDKQIEYEQIKAYKEMAMSNNAKVIILPTKTPLILGNQ